MTLEKNNITNRFPIKVSVPWNQALGVCRRFVPDLQVCGIHGREDLVDATIISNAKLVILHRLATSSSSSSSSSLTLEADVFPLSHRGCLFCRMLFVGCLTSQQHASVSQEQICLDKFTYCHTETEVADQTFYHTQPRYTDTGPTSPSADPITPGARK